MFDVGYRFPYFLRGHVVVKNSSVFLSGICSDESSRSKGVRVREVTEAELYQGAFLDKALDSNRKDL